MGSVIANPKKETKKAIAVMIVIFLNILSNPLCCITIISHQYVVFDEFDIHF